MTSLWALECRILSQNTDLRYTRPTILFDGGEKKLLYRLNDHWGIIYTIEREPDDRCLKIPFHVNQNVSVDQNNSDGQDFSE